MKEYIVTGKKDTRSGFGDGLYEAGKKNPAVVAMTPDLIGESLVRAVEKRGISLRDL